MIETFTTITIIGYGCALFDKFITKVAVFQFLIVVVSTPDVEKHMNPPSGYDSAITALQMKTNLKP